MSKYKFKKYIKKVISEKAFEYLIKIKEKHSKLNDISYTKLEMQNYIKSNNSFTDDEKCSLFQFRVRQIDVKCNYKNKYYNHQCELCTSNSQDDQYHLFQCEYLINNCKNLENNTTIEYEDIFDDTDTKKQIKAAKLLYEVWEKRLELTSVITDQCT